MKTTLGILVGIGLVLTSFASPAAQKPAGASKTAPACAALVFRPLPSGISDGEQIAGTYKSRFARLELSGTVQNGAPVNYYLGWIVRWRWHTQQTKSGPPRHRYASIPR